jgi:DNA-binding response OmpR family regulator
MKNFMDRVLVIEDDKIIAENLEAFFIKEGYNVDVAINGLDGYKKIELNIPDLIICDINMPQMDGFELKAKLNENKETFDIPLLFLTAKTQIAELRQGMSLGADDYIFKPYNSAELMKTVKLRLNKRKRVVEKYRLISSDSNRDYNINDTITVSARRRNKEIKVSDIKIILAEVQYSQIILADNSKYIMRVSLSQWEKKLPNDILKRVHKSAMVNLNFVENMYKSEKNYYLKLKNWNEKDIAVSRRKYQLLKSIL